MKIKVTAIAGFLIAPLLTGCPCNNCGSDGPFSPIVVEGTITDSVTLQPLADVTVANGIDPDVLSDEYGWYSISRPASRLTALKRGYQAHSADASEFPANTTFNYSFTMIPGDSADTVAPQTPIPDGISKSYSDSVIHWNVSAAEAPDFAGYVVYKGTEQVRLTRYNHIVVDPVEDIANCYSIAAIDASGNESPTGSRICAVLTGCAMSVDDRIEPELQVLSSNEIKVHWGVPASRPLQEHRIYRNGVLLSSLSLGENRDTTSSTDQFNYYTYSDANLSSGTEYCYSVATGNDQTQGCDQLCISTWQ